VDETYRPGGCDRWRSPRRRGNACAKVAVETAAQTLHRLTSMPPVGDPARWWDPPVDDPRVLRDLEVNDLDSLPWFHKRYPQPRPRVPLPRQLPVTSAGTIDVLAGHCDRPKCLSRTCSPLIVPRAVTDATRSGSLASWPTGYPAPCTTSHRRSLIRELWRYRPASAWYCSTMFAGIRPRSASLIFLRLAQPRMAWFCVGSVRAGATVRPRRDGCYPATADAASTLRTWRVRPAALMWSRLVGLLRTVVTPL
jgi:hypothetical protein